MRKWLVLLLCLVALPAHAGRYFNADAFPPTLLPPPHAEGSVAWQQEVGSIVRMQHAADKKEVAAAQGEYHMQPELMTVVLGPEITRERCPKLFALLDNAGDDSRAVTDRVKTYWNTRRPYLASSRIKALIQAHDNPSYPSGHTAGGVLWAEVMGEIFPQKRQALRARADAIAAHRVLAGMHYPQDIEGGRQLGWIMVGALWQSPAFQEDLAAARQEAAAGGAP